MNHNYLELIQQIERLHRHFLDLLKLELERHNIQDINNVQSLILYNIGEDEMTVGELTVRGYYLGSNVSYNVKKMVENGYLMQQRSRHDKRSLRVSLTDKGKDLRNLVSGMFAKHSEKLAGTDLGEEGTIRDIVKSLHRLERFWERQSDSMGF